MRVALVALSLLSLGARAPEWMHDLPWLELTSPEPAQSVSGSIGLVEIQGRAGTGVRAPVDVVLVLDLSESTFYPSGLDVDRDGLVGRLHERGVRRASGSLRPTWLWTTDPGDTIVAAEIEAARRLLGRLEAARTRVGLVRFAGHAREVTPVGPVDVALRALERIRPGPDPSGTNLGSAIRSGLRLLHRSARQVGAGRRQVLIVLSDGQPTSPAPAIHAHRYAIKAAERALASGVHVYAYALGSTREEAHVLAEMAEMTDGEFIDVQRIGDVVDHLPYTDFAGIDAVSMTNRTSGLDGRAIRLFGDGSFDGFVPLVAGENLLEVRVRSSKGDEMRTLRTVRYEPSSEVGTDLSRLLHVRTVETELAARARERREARKREVKLDIQR